MDNLDNFNDVIDINTEEVIKLELDSIYHVLSEKYNSVNRYGILSDIKCLINKISLIQNEKIKLGNR